MKLVNFLLILVVISFSSLTNGFAQHTSGGDSLSINEAKQQISFSTKEEKKIKHLNDIASFIAGLAVDSTSKLYQLSLSPEWKAYYGEAKKAWDKFSKVSDEVIAWRNQEIPAAQEPIQTLFYPFGGPDYLFANIFFPNARNYIMIGLENPGSVPQFDASNKDSLKNILAMYKAAIEDVIQLSFFRTVDMKNELANKAIDGTAPIIMLFLARSGKQILKVTPMMLNEVGDFEFCNKKSKQNAIEIQFRNTGDTITRHIYYLSTNLADPSLSKNKPFMKFLGNIDDKSVSLIKSATYLMHKSYFSIIRNTVLKKSTLILQDPSGIAYKFFDKSQWNITLYGTYEKPINLFKDFYEPDLSQAFAESSKPLDFRIGYNKKSNLLLALRKQ